jgi:hypothetical protein
MENCLMDKYELKPDSYAGYSKVVDSIEVMSMNEIDEMDKEYLEKKKHLK